MFNISNLLLSLDVSLNIPPFLYGKRQFDEHEVIETRRIASLRSCGSRHQLSISKTSTLAKCKLCIFLFELHSYNYCWLVQANSTPKHNSSDGHYLTPSTTNVHHATCEWWQSPWGVSGGKSNCLACSLFFLIGCLQCLVFLLQLFRTFSCGLQFPGFLQSYFI